VQPGETLYGIARAYYGSGMHWRVLAEVNQLGDGGTPLRVGQHLEIPPLDGPRLASTGPASPPTEPGPTGGDTYVIQPGDTWWRIATEQLGNGNEWPVIARANPEVDVSRPLQVGQRLIIPRSD
jgi:nucleoid-associated protein YgaU